MDAATLVAAALSIAMDQSRDAAMEELLRQREIQAMHAAGLESYMAQRMYTENLQLPQRPGAPHLSWPPPAAPWSPCPAGALCRGGWSPALLTLLLPMRPGQAA